MNNDLKKQLKKHAAEIRRLAIGHSGHAPLLVTLGDLIDALVDGADDQTSDIQQNNHAASPENRTEKI